MPGRTDIRPTRSFDDLVALMHILRQECPWDREQTHASLKDLMVEEVYEAIDAIDRGDMADLRKELGDMLLHVVFHAEMAGETAAFTMADVIEGLQEKLIRRHPHIFADTAVSGTGDVLRNWEQIKLKEGGRKSVLDGVPRHLPGLLRAQRMQDKASGVGFDWNDWRLAWVKLDEELQEWKTTAESADREELRKEFGDVLFSLVNVGRLLGIDAEDSLRMTNTKFQSRFEHIENRLAEAGRKPGEATLEEMDVLWEEAKRKERGNP